MIQKNNKTEAAKIMNESDETDKNIMSSSAALNQLTLGENKRDSGINPKKIFQSGQHS